MPGEALYQNDHLVRGVVDDGEIRRYRARNHHRRTSTGFVPIASVRETHWQVGFPYTMRAFHRRNRARSNRRSRHPRQSASCTRAGLGREGWIRRPEIAVPSP
jgi:hypothetical protein